jgi:hypothetical protein
MEMHIVHYIMPDQIPECKQEPLGICPYVTGFFMALSEEDNPAFTDIFADLPVNPVSPNCAAKTMIDLVITWTVFYFLYVGRGSPL